MSVVSELKEAKLLAAAIKLAKQHSSEIITEEIEKQKIQQTNHIIGHIHFALPGPAAKASHLTALQSGTSLL